MATEIAEAKKNRPRIVDTKPWMSISSIPTRKKRIKTPTPRKTCKPGPGSIRPETGPSTMPVTVKATIELKPRRPKMPSASLATTTSIPMGNRVSIMANSFRITQAAQCSLRPRDCPVDVLFSVGGGHDPRLELGRCNKYPSLQHGGEVAPEGGNVPRFHFSPAITPHRAANGQCPWRGS